jgi:hypothetical protein
VTRAVYPPSAPTHVCQCRMAMARSAHGSFRSVGHAPGQALVLATHAPSGLQILDLVASYFSVRRSSIRSCSASIVPVGVRVQASVKFGDG